MKQQAFKTLPKTKSAFGGTLLKGNAKTRRPLNTKMPLHLVLRSTHPTSLRSPKVFGEVNRQVKTAAEKYGFKIYEFANVGDHLHVLMRVPNRHLWGRFIREVTGGIAALMRRVRDQKVWAHKPFTRVVQGWRRDFKNVKTYIFLNELEGGAVITPLQKRILSQLRAFWSD